MTVQRTKVLFAIDSLTGGGAERVLTRLANSFSRDVFNVQLVKTLAATARQTVAPHVPVVDLFEDALTDIDSMPSGGAMADRLMARGALAALGPSYWNKAGYQDLVDQVRVFRSAVKCLARHVAAWSPDCVLSFLPNTNLITLVARHCYDLRTAVVCSDRNFLSRELATLEFSPLRHRLTRAFYPRADRHVTMTDAAAEDLHVSFGISRKQMVTIGNGVDAEGLGAQAGEDLPQSWQELQRGRTPTLIQVGRLTAQKGNEILIRALARIPKRPWRLLMLGDGELKDPLIGLVNQLGLAERIHFLGWDRNPYRWIARSDLFVLSSRWEGFPNALLEAMALGVATIATDCPTGPAEILDGGRFGRLVPSEAPATLAEAIEQLLLDHERRKRLAALGAQRALEYSMGKMVRRFEDLIRETAEAYRRRAR